MTDFLPFTPEEYAVDAPATALHFERWFRNWIAGFEGAISAPRILLGALERLLPGTSIRYRADAVQSITSATFATVANFTLDFIQAGTVTIAFEHNAASSTSEVRIYRRRAGTSTLLTTISQGGTTYVAKTYDVDVLPGDQIFLQHRNTSSSTSNIRNLRLQVDAASFYWPVSNFGSIEGNPVIATP